MCFFPRILESLPPLPRQHSAAIGCTKNCVESFEGPLQRCRWGRGCSELWKNTYFPEHPVVTLLLSSSDLDFIIIIISFIIIFCIIINIIAYSQFLSKESWLRTLIKELVKKINSYKALIRTDEGQTLWFIEMLYERVYARVKWIIEKLRP